MGNKSMDFEQNTKGHVSWKLEQTILLEVLARTAALRLQAVKQFIV